MIKLPIVHKKFYTIQSIALNWFFIFWVLIGQSSHSLDGQPGDIPNDVISLAILPLPVSDILENVDDEEADELHRVVCESCFDYSKGFSKCKAMYDFYANHSLTYCPMSSHQLWDIERLSIVASKLIEQLNQGIIDAESVNALLYTLYQTAYYHVFYYAFGVGKLINFHFQNPDAINFNRDHIEVLDAFLAQRNITDFYQKIFNVLPSEVATPSNVWTPMTYSLDTRFSIGLSPYSQAIIDVVCMVNPETCYGEPSRAKDALEKFKDNIKKQKHFDTWISPLLQLEIGIQYLGSTSSLNWIRHLWRLIGLVIQEKIPYELKEPNYKNGQTTDDPSMAMRMQLYHQMPLAEICALAIQMHAQHSSGDTFVLSEQNLSNMTRVLQSILPSIQILLNFEIDVAEGRVPNSNPALSQHDLAIVRSFGAHYQDVQNLSKMQKYLNDCLCDKTRLTNTPIGRYAIMRALEVIGEAGKKLSLSIKKPSPLFWKQMATIRNYFSHLSEKGNVYLQKAIYQEQYNQVFADLNTNLEEILIHINYLLGQLSQTGPDESDLSNSPKLPDLVNFLEFLKNSFNLEVQLKKQLLAKQVQLKKKVLNEFCSANSTNMKHEDFEELVNMLLISDTEKNQLKDLHKKYINSKNKTLSSKQQKLLDLIFKSDQNIQKAIGKMLAQVYQARSWEDAQQLASSWDSEELELLKKIYDSKQSTPKKDLSERTSSLQDALEAIPEINQVILQLSMITKPFGRDTEAFNNDPVLYMACEHLISLFRDDALKVRKSIFWVNCHPSFSSDNLNEYSNLLTELDDSLHDAIVNANGILHHHDTTEMPFLPIAGHRWVMSMEVANFIGCTGHLPKKIRNFQRLLQAILNRPTSPQFSSFVLSGTLEDNTVLSFTEQPLPADNDCGFHGIGISRESAVTQLMNASSDPRIRSLIAPDIFAAFQSEFMVLNSLNLPSSDRNHIQDLAQARYDAQLKIDACIRAINDILEPSVGYRMNLTEIMKAIEDGFDFTQIPNEYIESLQYLFNSISKSYRDEQSSEATLREYSEDESVYRSFVLNYLNPTQWLSYVRGSTGILDALAAINNLSIYIWTPDPSHATQLHLTHRTATRPNLARTIHLIHRDGLTHFNTLVLNETPPTPVEPLPPVINSNDTHQEDEDSLDPIFSLMETAQIISKE